MAGAAVMVDGRLYRADARGRVVVPLLRGGVMRVAVQVDGQEAVYELDGSRGGVFVLALSPRAQQARVADVPASAQEAVPAQAGAAQPRQQQPSSAGWASLAGRLPSWALPLGALVALVVALALGAAGLTRRAGRGAAAAASAAGGRTAQALPELVTVPTPTDADTYLQRVCAEALMQPVPLARWERRGYGWASADGALLVTWLTREELSRAGVALGAGALEVMLLATPSEPLAGQRLSMLWDGQQVIRTWRVYRMHHRGEGAYLEEKKR